MFSVPQCLSVSFRSVVSLTPTITVVAAVIEEDDAFLVTRRPDGVHLAGLWEFPGGKIDPAESHADALKREMREELDADVEVLDLVFETTHAYPERAVALYFYRCVLKQRPRPLLGQQMQWIKRSELGSLGFPPADEDLIRLLTAERPTFHSQLPKQP